MAKRLIAPSLWAGWKPFGLGETKSRHFQEIFKTAWENKRHPLYAWRILYTGGTFKTSDGKGHFSALVPPDLQIPEGKFALSTRRGKQFNSLIHANTDPLTGAKRLSLLVSAGDAARLEVQNGDRVMVHSDNGASMEFVVRIDSIKPRNVQAFWPECNPLIRRRVCDTAAGVPDYNAIVDIVPLRTPMPVMAGARAGQASE